MTLSGRPFKISQAYLVDNAELKTAACGLALRATTEMGSSVDEVSQICN